MGPLCQVGAMQLPHKQTGILCSARWRLCHVRQGAVREGEWRMFLPFEWGLFSSSWEHGFPLKNTIGNVDEKGGGVQKVRHFFIGLLLEKRLF